MRMEGAWKHYQVWTSYVFFEWQIVLMGNIQSMFHVLSKTECLQQNEWRNAPKECDLKHASLFFSYIQLPFVNVVCLYFKLHQIRIAARCFKRTVLHWWVTLTNTLSFNPRTSETGVNTKCRITESQNAWR